MRKGKYLLVVAGPTAVGKTALAIQLARHYHTVILSADSRQFYRELAIGTAKPDEEQLAQATHYFINNKSITELYGAGHYEKDAIPLLNGLFETHDLVILVGGSGLYIDAVLHGVDEFAEVPEATRTQLNQEYEQKGLEWLQQEVKHADPDYFASVDPNNPQRLIRALEVIRHTGHPYSGFLNQPRPQRDFTPIRLLINTDREQLYRQINQRVDEMMKKNLLEEVKQYLPFKHFNALKTVGYKELYDHLDGTCSLEEAVEKIKQHTRNYAKRQLTWFRNRDTFEEFRPNDLDKIIAYVDVIMQYD